MNQEDFDRIKTPPDLSHIAPVAFDSEVTEEDFIKLNGHNTEKELADMLRTGKEENYEYTYEDEIDYHTQETEQYEIDNDVLATLHREEDESIHKTNDEEDREIPAQDVEEEQSSKDHLTEDEEETKKVKRYTDMSLINADVLDRLNTMEQREEKITRVGSLLKEAVLNSTKSIGNWQKHLDFTAQFYKYGFLEQILIEKQRPDATMCATYDTWKNKLGRQVKDGANGIPLLTERNGKISMWHVFDVSDTVGNEKSIPVKAWEMKPEYRAAVGERLGKGSIDGYINARIDEMLANIFDRYVNDIFRSRDNSLLDGLDRDNISLRFRGIVKAGAKYAIEKRCGLEPDFNKPRKSPTSKVGCFLDFQ